MRSILDIPVLGPGQASYLTALMLGNNFSILTLWESWRGLYLRNLADYGLLDRCRSIRSPDFPPNVENQFAGRREEVFPLLLEQGLKCVEEDGADVICIGSTTMYEAHPFSRRTFLCR